MTWSRRMPQVQDHVVAANVVTIALNLIHDLLGCPGDHAVRCDTLEGPLFVLDRFHPRLPFSIEAPGLEEAEVLVKQMRLTKRRPPDLLDLVSVLREHERAHDDDPGFITVLVRFVPVDLGP